MADFNGDNVASSSSSRKASTTMAKLDDDLIIKVVARLPLKVAVQCTTLNKSLSRLIFTPAFARRAAAARHSSSMVFYCSSKNPKIYTRLCVCRELTSTSTALSLSNRDPGASVTLERETTISASCNGLLLLHYGQMYSHYVFNPTTGGIMFVNFPVERLTGLAVDFAAEYAHFKLVSLHVSRESDTTFLTFSLLVPTAGSSGPSMVLESEVGMAGGAPAKIDDNIQPVYAHGSLFWLGDDGRTTIAFDVEKQLPRTVSGPINENDTDRARDRWFGVADGSVQFVCALPEEIVIYGYEHRRDEWGVKYRVATLSNPSNNHYGHGAPLFYDGGHLFFMIRKRGEDGHVFIYHVSKGGWERGWDVAGWTDSKQSFFSFFPTIAKVSSLHLSDMNDPTRIWRGTRDASSFRGFMRLLSPVTH